MPPPNALILQPSIRQVFEEAKPHIWAQQRMNIHNPTQPADWLDESIWTKLLEFSEDQRFSPLLSPSHYINLAHFAAWAGSVNLLEWVKRNHSELLRVSTTRGYTLAHFAAWSRDANALEWVNKNLPELIDTATDKGLTIVDFAALAANIAGLEWAQKNRNHLLFYCCKKSVFHFEHYAIRSGNPAAFHWARRYIEQCPSWLHVKTFSGWQYAHMAAVSSNFEVLQLIKRYRPGGLIEKDETNRTIEDYAFRQDNLRLVRWIKKNVPELLDWRRTEGYVNSILNNQAATNDMALIDVVISTGYAFTSDKLIEVLRANKGHLVEHLIRKYGNQFNLTTMHALVERDRTASSMIYEAYDSYLTSFTVDAHLSHTQLPKVIKHIILDYASAATSIPHEAIETRLRQRARICRPLLGCGGAKAMVLHKQLTAHNTLYNYEALLDTLLMQENHPDLLATLLGCRYSMMALDGTLPPMTRPAIRDFFMAKHDALWRTYQNNVHDLEARSAPLRKDLMLLEQHVARYATTQQALLNTIDNTNLIFQQMCSRHSARMRYLAYFILCTSLINLAIVIAILICCLPAISPLFLFPVIILGLIAPAACVWASSLLEKSQSVTTPSIYKENFMDKAPQGLPYPQLEPLEEYKNDNTVPLYARFKTLTDTIDKQGENVQWLANLSDHPLNISTASKCAEQRCNEKLQSYNHFIASNTSYINNLLVRHSFLFKYGTGITAFNFTVILALGILILSTPATVPVLATIGFGITAIGGLGIAASAVGFFNTRPQPFAFKNTLPNFLPTPAGVNASSS